jgi:hypothetical protein
MKGAHMRKRFKEPLDPGVKVNFATVRGMAECLDEMAGVRGISRSELVRRLVARAIVEDAPDKLGRIARHNREAIETLADL